MVQLSTNRFFCVNHKQPLSLVYDILRKHLHKSNRLFTYPRRCLYFLVNEISGKSKGISSQTFTEVIVFSWTGCNPNAHAIDFYHLGISWRSKLNSRDIMYNILGHGNATCELIQLCATRSLVGIFIGRCDLFGGTNSATLARARRR